MIVAKLCLVVDVENSLPLHNGDGGTFRGNLETEAKEDLKCNGNHDVFPRKSLVVQEDMSCRLLGIGIISK